MGRYNKTKPIVKEAAKKQTEELFQPVAVTSFFSNKIIYLIIILFSFAYYGNTVLNDYSLDDAIVITQNEFTKEGLSGIKDIFSTELFTGFFKEKKNLVVGGRYRPLSVATFAVEWDVFGSGYVLSDLIYKRNKGSFDEMKTLNVPKDVIDRLKPLNSVPFETTQKMDSAIISKVGQASLDQYRGDIYSCTRNAYGSPGVSHFINVLLFGLIGIILYNILDRLFRKFKINDKWYSNIPFIATLLYLAHPIHTEVLANIKGRDELLSLLGVLIAFLFTLKYLENKSSKFLLLSFLAFLGSMFSKEIGVTFLVTIPLAIWFFTDSKWKYIFISLLPLLASTLLYFLIRGEILGDQTAKVLPELMNDSFLYMTNGQKFATITYTMGVYLKLIFFPHPLTYDYYPYHIPITEWSHWHAFGSLIVVILLAVVAIKGLKHKTVISFGILFYAVSLAPVSNILFPIGAFMNERFVFVASLGFCIILAWFLGYKLPQLLKNDTRKMKMIPLILLVIFLLYGFKTVTRNTDWKNDFTLFTTDVKVSVNGAKSNCSAGGKLIEEAIKPENKGKRSEYIRQAIKYLNHSLEIYPTYGDAILLLGNAWFQYNKNYDSTVIAYKTLLRLTPNHKLVFTNLEDVFRNLDSTDYKIKVYKEFYEINPNRYEVNYALGNLYGRYKNDLIKSTYYLNKSIAIYPNNAVALRDLGVAYGMSMKFDSSIFFFKKALEIEPNDAQIYLNIGISYLNTNRKAEAQQYLQKAKELDPKINIPK